MEKKNKMNQLNNHNFAHNLRVASPYIVEHQNKVFLIMLNESTLKEQNEHKFIEDLLLLHRIGNHLIFIADLNQSTEQPIDKQQRDELIDREQELWQKFQALWFKHNQKADLLKTNLLQVRPNGVKSGKDFLYAAKVQGIFNAPIQPLLEQQWAIWQSCWGHSFSGVPYILSALDVATAIASTIHCDKLIYLDTKSIQTQSQNLSNNLSLYQAKKISTTEKAIAPAIKMAISACKSGIQRIHFLNIQQDGALLCELFTRDGVGLLVYNDIYDELMIADESCANDILELIHTINESDNILNRNKDFIDKNLSNFYVMRRENKVIACAALHPLGNGKKPNQINKTSKEITQLTEIAEIACLIVHPQYQSMGIASQLINHIVQQAKKQNISHIIALTVKAQGWFQRHNFKPISPQKLPQISNKVYDYQRNATIFYREI